MAYDLNWTNSTNTFYDLVVNVNAEMNGMFMYIFLFSLYIIIILILLKSDKDILETFAVSSIIMTFTCVFFFAAGVIPMYVIGIPVTVGGIALITKGFT